MGCDDPQTLQAVGNMGALLQDQGKFDLAEPYYRLALEGCERTMGPDHSQTLSALNNLGKPAAISGQA